MTARGLSTTERFWAKVQIGPGCWEWTARRNRKGYGVATVLHSRPGHNRQIEAHRVAYALAAGPIPVGRLVLHHCDNPACVKTEPDAEYPEGHLFLGTYRDNVRDMLSKGRGRWQRLAALAEIAARVPRVIA
jgi:HNH endonuclease